MPEIGNLALSYVAGALSTLSPCVLPLLPIVLFGVLERHVWGPVALADGLSASFAPVASQSLQSASILASIPPHSGMRSRH